MSLIPSSGVDNAQVPGVTAEVYLPDQLIAGRFPLVTDTVTITGGAKLLRGSLLGQVTIGAASSAAKTGGNTGTGTLALDGTTPVLAGAQVGIYTVSCTAAGTNSATFRVNDPKGNVLGDVSFSGAGASVTFSDQIKFTITDAGTDFVVGDGFNITLAAGSGSYKLAAAAAIDGSATPVAVLADTADATGGDVAAGVYLAGEFNSAAMTFGSGLTATNTKDALRARSIYLKSAVSAADPS